MATIADAVSRIRGQVKAGFKMLLLLIDIFIA